MASQQYRYRLLRFVPRAETGEFYNIGLVVYGVDGGVVDATAARHHPFSAISVSASRAAASPDACNRCRGPSDNISEKFLIVSCHIPSN